MPERVDRVEKVRAGRPLCVGGVALLPIERVVVRSHPAARGGWVIASVEPYALVVRDGRRLRVLVLAGVSVSLAQLRERIPGLDASLGMVDAG